MNKLWTKNFTIITLGSIVSMLGNAISGFALSVLILDLTDSSLAFAIYLALYSLPKLVVPIIAGTLLDRFSRVKVIYGLDFLSSVLFLFIFLGLTYNFLTYPLFLVIAVLIGTIDSVYSVAYDSLYPTLVSEGNFSKAYSISSMIYPLAAMMTPLAAFVHSTIGLEILFFVNSITFFIAALFETQIKTDETHIKKDNRQLTPKQFKEEYKLGFNYLFSEKGLLTITLFFFCNSLFQSSIHQTLTLPYFKNTPGLSYTLYTFVSVANVFGRFLGGLIHYRHKIPKQYKFGIAMFVYTVLCFFEGFYLYFPIYIMIVVNFLIGIHAVTSFNIRISSTQHYVPNHLRGRFNGTFQMVTTTGMILGQLIWGSLGEVFDPRILIILGNAITLTLTYLVVYRNREHVKPIYNQTL